MIARRSIAAFAGACALATGLLGVHAAGASAYPTASAAPTTRYAFQLVASPHDATFTQLLGINEHQAIVGYDGSGQTAGGVLHPNKGFTLTLPNTFTPENYPNSAQTQVIGINNRGDTDGFYIDQTGATHGFLAHNGSFSTTDLPGTPFNQLLGLNNRGQEAGYFQDAAGLNHAYVRDAQGVFTVLPLPNSQATGINDHGVVVGFTQPTTTTSSAFVWQNERATLLNYRGSTFTQALGENNQGQIVGTYNDAAGTGHGFVYWHGAFQTIDVPGSSATVVNGINNRGQIVGFFTDAAGNTVGFVGTPTTSHATTLVASLLGKNEAPGPGDPSGGGTALVTLYPSRSQVCYSIAVGGLQGTVTEAHIHQGAAGATGPVVVHFMAPDQGAASGCVGVDAHLLAQMAQHPAGFYVNVHTTTFMAGAARGQLATGPLHAPPPGPSTTTALLPAAQQILVAPLAGVATLPTFDPALARDQASLSAITMVFTGLLGQDARGAVQPALAQTYHVSTDGLTWTFTLKPHLTFSDGTPLTATAVAASLDRAFAPEVGSATAPAALGLIKDAAQRAAGSVRTLIGDSILTPDPTTVIIQAQTPWPAASFLDLLAQPWADVVEPALVARYGAQWTAHLSEGGGAGPWKVAQEMPGHALVFVPNPSYPGPRPQLRKVVMPYYAQADAAYAAYQQGLVDLAPVPPTQVAQAQTLPGGQYHRAPQWRLNYVGLNFLSKPFDNVKIRQAFALALNKDLLAQTVFADTITATNHLVPQGSPGYNALLTGPEGTQPNGDARLAKQLFQQGLQEEGFASPAQLPPLTLTVATGGAAALQNEVAVLQQQWQSVLGVTVRSVDVPLPTLLQDLATTPGNRQGLQMWLTERSASAADAEDWTTRQFAPGAAFNAVNYGQNTTSNAAAQQALQSALAQADRTADPAGQLQAYNQAEQQLVNDVAWLPLAQINASFVRTTCVQGLVDTPLGVIPAAAWGSVVKVSAASCADTRSWTTP